jgi:pimeloyl-ACP methyl ester carboxylesterase
MALATVDGLDIAYDVVGGGDGPPWVLTPGGRFSKDTPGLRALAEALAAAGRRVVLWDRPNTGASSVCFEGVSESQTQADALAGLLRHLGTGPAVIAGGSGGSRVSLLAAAAHPDVTRGVATWWISGGVFGLLSIGVHYGAGSVSAAWNGGMEAVAALPEWQEVLERHPANRARLLAQEPRVFIGTMERWMLAYCPCGDDVVPGLPAAAATALDVPALVFRSGVSDPHHTRATSERVAAALPRARLVEPPWPDTEWIDRQATRQQGLFVRWPLLAPALLAWEDEAVLRTAR